MGGNTRAGRKRTRRVLGIVGAGLLVATCGVLAGCTAAASNSAATAAAGSVAVGYGAAGDDDGGGATSAAATSAAEASPEASGSGVGDGAASSDTSGGTGGSPAAPIVDDRQIIRTATVALQIAVPQGKDDEATTAALNAAASAAAVKVRALAPGTGGYVSASDGGGATISVTLRIPAGSYDAVMNGLAGIGEVTSRTEKTDDVTDEMVDVTSRIATMKASVDRIRLLLAKADKISDVMAIESELTQREADLESLENRQTALANQVALSTIAVTITAVTPVTVAAVPVPQEQHGFLAGLSNGWHALLSFGTWLGSVVGALLPFLPVIAVVVAVALWISRRRRRTIRHTGGPSDSAPESS